MQALILGIAGLVVAGIQSLSILLNRTEEETTIIDDITGLLLIAVGGYIVYRIV